MSRVRYVNKKTGWVSIYESTPYYDPVTKASRPKRKYIGYEDPITKEFIPSSGKPGRKKHEQIDTSSPDSPTRSNQLEYKRALDELGCTVRSIRIQYLSKTYNEVPDRPTAEINP